MKKGLALLCVLAMSASMLTACGTEKAAETETAAPAESAAETEAAGEDTAATEPAAEETERTTFTVGFDAEFPPYGYMDDNGEYVDRKSVV